MADRFSVALGVLTGLACILLEGDATALVVITLLVVVPTLFGDKVMDILCKEEENT